MPFALTQNPDGITGQQAGSADPGTPDPAAIGDGNQQPAPAESGKEPGSTAQPGKTGEGSLTLDDVRKVIGEVVAPIVREETSKVYRANQSANAKLEERVKANFKQQIADLQKAGVTPTAEQSQALLDQTRARVLTEAEGEGKPGGQRPVTQQPATQETPVNPVVAIAMKIIHNAGIEAITEDCPEYSMIDQKTDDEKEFLDSVQKAADTMKARLQTQGNTRARNTALAAGPGKGAGGGLANNNNIEDLYKLGFNS